MGRSNEFAKKTEKFALKRQKNRCACCGTTISKLGLAGAVDHRYGETAQAHHMLPIRVGGTNELSNCVILCQSCHYSAHEGGNYRRGTVVACEADLEFFRG